MAKKKKRRTSKTKRKTSLIKKLVRFFVPTEIRSSYGWLWFGVSRVGTALTTLFVSLTLLFAMLPVPFSAYMVQKRVEHWLTGDNYTLNYHWVSLDKISWQMQMAVIAGEDQQFANHFGFDWRSIQIAFQANSKSKKVRGASTISQQTVKNLYLWQGASWVRKGIELPLTLLTETLWDKSRILEVYLNIAEFGDGIFGVEAAAQHFFKKSAKNLSLQESALLAAALPNPLIYRVDKPNSTIRNRQAWIMQQVQNLGGKNYLCKL